MISLLFLPNEVTHLHQLVVDFVQLYLRLGVLLVDILCLGHVIAQLGGKLREGGPQEELAVTHAASAPHFALFLDVAQGQIFKIGYCLLREDSQFKSAFFARLVPTELARVLVVLFEVFVAHDAEGFGSKILLCGLGQSENRV